MGLLLPALIFFSGTARAETVVMPKVSAKAEYDDNIRFSRENRDGDLVLSLSPSITLSHRTERLQSDTSAMVRALKYAEESDLDREEIHFNTDLSYGLSERVSLQGDASFQLDSALESELQETGIVTEQSDRTRMSAGGGLTFQLTRFQELGGSFSLGQTNYESDRFLDYDTAYAALNWSRSFRDERDLLTIRPYWSHNSSDVSDVDTYGLMAGWKCVLTERWSLTAFLGVRRTETESLWVQRELVFNPARRAFVLDEHRETREETHWGAVADMRVRWTSETWAFGASYKRDLSYTAQGEPIERDLLALSLRKEIDERLTAHCRGSAIFSQYEGIASNEDFRHFSVSPSLSYRLTENYHLTAGYSYAYHENDRVDDSGRDRNRVWVSLDCAFPELF